MEQLLSTSAARDRFTAIFPGGFADSNYLERERNWKVAAYQRWKDGLSEGQYRDLLHSESYSEIRKRLLHVYGTLNLLYKNEITALREALAADDGARLIAMGLFSFLYGQGEPPERFRTFAQYLDAAPQRGTRLRWPVITVFPFLAEPKRHAFLKPDVTKVVAAACGKQLNYKPNPNWLTYSCLLDLYEHLSRSLSDLAPRDHIDIQSFIWVSGSKNYH